MHTYFKKITNISGFATENARPGEMAEILVRASLTSDENDFYRYVEQFEKMFLSSIGVFSNTVYQFLAVVHEDSSADLYVNDFPVLLEMRSKRAMEKGAVVRQNDIADILRLRFPDIQISESDKVVYCFKAGWRFGMFFDLGARFPSSAEPGQEEDLPKLDIDGMELSIGSLYRALSFYEVYRTLQAEAQYQAMISDGWFPFVETIPTDYGLLCAAYENKFDFENKLIAVIARFDQARIEATIERWWANGHFEKKKGILQAGVNAYLQDNAEGFVNCIKTLGTEIEGLLRLIYLEDTKRGRAKIKQLLTHFVGKGQEVAGDGYSLILAIPFFEYLRDVIFADFDVDTGKVDLSRNTVGHGVAGIEQYSKARALQMILVLDQIYFFNQSPKGNASVL